jgi:hypothetical protein
MVETKQILNPFGNFLVTLYIKHTASWESYLFDFGSGYYVFKPEGREKILEFMRAFHRLNYYLAKKTSFYAVGNVTVQTKDYPPHIAKRMFERLTLQLYDSNNFVIDKEAKKLFDEWRKWENEKERQERK